MPTFFTADLHFNHSGVLRYCNRPWKTVKEMNEALVERWNATVRRESDIVWVLGDFAFKHPDGDDIAQIFHRLRGVKHLVIGNHDERNPQVLRLPWERQEKLVTFRDQGRRAELSHYPLETWKGGHYGSLMLHGHCHGSLKRVIPHRFDVGVDVFPDGPVDFETLWETASRQTYAPQDSHGESS